MLQYGGIALDSDVFVVQSLSPFLHYEMSLGWPRGQNIGNQVVVAHRGARLLRMWLGLYQEYRPALWYYNAGEAPTQVILKDHPELVHRVETQFGVENLADRLYNQRWDGWTQRTTIHLLYRHRNYLTNKNITLDENNFRLLNCTISDMIAIVISKLPDSIEIHIIF